MNRSTAVLLLLLVLFSLGCVGLQSDNNPRTPEPEHATAPPQRSTTTSPPQTSVPTTSGLSKVNEYERSGRAFYKVVRDRMGVHRTTFVSGQAYENNTVKMSIALYANTGEFADGSLRASTMDVTQAVATAVDVRTTSNDSRAMANGTKSQLHQPKKVVVRIQDVTGNTIGKFEINPRLARAYMDRRFSSKAFANHVLGSIELEQEVPRGKRSPEWYLNLSQLRNWGLVYIQEVRDLSEPSDGVFNEKISVQKLTSRPDEFQLHHEIMGWNSEEMGQYATSAEATIYGAYWRATAKSWALPPKSISVYIHVSGKKDLKGYMDRKHVYELLSAPTINQTTLTRYQRSSRTDFVAEED